jgi:hypothetical protein
MQILVPKGRKKRSHQSRFLPPVPGWVILRNLPRARALGCILAPLRGYGFTDYRRIRPKKYNTADKTTLTTIDVANGK